MLHYDHHPSGQRDAIERRQAVLDTIVDYRFLAPHKIAADERILRAMGRAAHVPKLRDSPSVARQPGRDALRYRLGTLLIAAGNRLRGSAAIALDPRPGT